MMVTFTIPYVIFIIGVAYNIQQTLDATGISLVTPLAIDSSGYAMITAFDIQYGIGFLVFFLLIYLMLLFVFSMVAAYCVGRWKGLLAGVFIWCVPGTLSVLGYWPKIQFLPEIYNVWGAGYLGSAVGMTCLLIMGLITGWNLFIILTDIFSLQDRFRHFYDHVWYSMAIVAAVFFVADTGAGENQRHLQDDTQQFQQASTYLADQLRQYDRHCAQEKLNLASCAWAHRMRQELAEYATYNDKLILALVPKTTREIYIIYNRDADNNTAKKIREELDTYNQATCQNGPGSYDCVRTPSVYCLISDPPKNFYDYSHHQTIVANECIIPTLVLLQKRIASETKKVSASSEQKHIRWFFYFLLSVLAGGKVANATARWSKSGKNRAGLGDKRRIIGMTSAAWEFLIASSRQIFCILNRLFCRLLTQCAKLRTAIKRSVNGRPTEDRDET
ncbi:hypothetical protein [Raoultella scottii]|uniref:hypothetical protein n=1 Tax=Raoultella scottii TaxID=3040937 RepID=UPI002FAE693B